MIGAIINSKRTPLSEKISVMVCKKLPKNFCEDECAFESAAVVDTLWCDDRDISVPPNVQDAKVRVWLITRSKTAQSMSQG